MKLRNLALGTIAAAGLCSFAATDAMAQSDHTGFDARLAITVPIVQFSQDVKLTYEIGSPVSKSNTSTDYDQMFYGIAGSISLGYRFGMFGIYIEQDLGGVWMDDENKDKGYPYDDKGHFLGGTYLMFRGLLGVTSNFEVDLGIGLGAMYSDGDKLEDAGKADYKIPLISNADGDPSGAFALKVGVGATYFINDSIGIGLNFDYSVGINKYEASNVQILGMKYKREVSNYIHVMQPGVHIRAQF